MHTQQSQLTAHTRQRDGAGVGADDDDDDDGDDDGYDDGDVRTARTHSGTHTGTSTSARTVTLDAKSSGRTARRVGGRTDQTPVNLLRTASNGECDPSLSSRHDERNSVERAHTPTTTPTRLSCVCVCVCLCSTVNRQLLCSKKFAHRGGETRQCARALPVTGWSCWPQAQGKHATDTQCWHRI